MKPDVLKPDVLKLDVLWVYHLIRSYSMLLGRTHKDDFDVVLQGILSILV
jgi:hypothetical protein